MPDRSFLIVHGLEGSGEGHWQRWVAAELERAGEPVHFPDLPDPYDPEPDAWQAELVAALARMKGERVAMCHSLACQLWLLAASRDASVRANRVLLVAPPHRPDLPPVARFAAVPPDRDRIHAASADTLIVCSDEDPYNPDGAVRTHAELLGLPHELLPGAGHVNPDAGYGPWPAGLGWALGGGLAAP
jgi:predicted alpha/beta hydrolase family esterase